MLSGRTWSRLLVLMYCTPRMCVSFSGWKLTRIAKSVSLGEEHKWSRHSYMFSYRMRVYILACFFFCFFHASQNFFQIDPDCVAGISSWTHLRDEKSPRVIVHANWSRKLSRRCKLGEGVIFFFFFNRGVKSWFKFKSDGKIFPEIFEFCFQKWFLESRFRVIALLSGYLRGYLDEKQIM